MRPWLPAILALSVAAPAAEPEDAPRKKLPGSSLLPDGSQLHGVVIPRHDKKRNLVNSLMADVVTLVNDELVDGQRVTIDFFDKLGERSARIKLKQARFNQISGMLHATEKVTMDADTYRARGTGLHYSIDRGNGLLIGPTTTWINKAPKTAMKPKTSAIIGATGAVLIAQSGALAPAQDADKPETKAVRVNTVEQNPIIQARKETQEQLKQELEKSSITDAEVKAFIENTPLEYEKVTGEKPTPAPNKPLEVKPDPLQTVVNCDGGMYFDPDKGLLVYMKNVRVDDPQYILTGADVLKIYMAKEPEKPKAKDKKGAEKPAPEKAEPKPADPKAKEAEDKAAPADKKGPVPAIGGNFDKVERIVATGAVRIHQKAVEKGKQPVEASGALFTYNPETGDILLSGGYPWVKQGDFFARAKEPNLTLRMKKDGSFDTEGNWEMGGRLNQNKPKQPNKPKPNN